MEVAKDLVSSALPRCRDISVAGPDTRSWPRNQPSLATSHSVGETETGPKASLNKAVTVKIADIVLRLSQGAWMRRAITAELADAAGPRGSLRSLNLSDKRKQSNRQFSVTAKWREEFDWTAEKQDILLDWRVSAGSAPQMTEVGAQSTGPPLPWATRRLSSRASSLATQHTLFPCYFLWRSADTFFSFRLNHWGNVPTMLQCHTLLTHSVGPNRILPLLDCAPEP